MRAPVLLRRAYKLINHGPTTLITSASGEHRNVMAAAWVMALDYDPPRVAAVIASGTHTRTLVEESGEFVVNVPTLGMIDTVYAVGKTSGADEDKFAQHGLVTTPASIVGSPLLEGCAAWLECRLIREQTIAEKYDLFVADVVLHEYPRVEAVRLRIAKPEPPGLDAAEESVEVSLRAENP